MCKEFPDIQTDLNESNDFINDYESDVESENEINVLTDFTESANISNIPGNVEIPHEIQEIIDNWFDML